MAPEINTTDPSDLEVVPSEGRFHPIYQEMTSKNVSILVPPVPLVPLIRRLPLCDGSDGDHYCRWRRRGDDGEGFRHETGMDW